MTETEREIKRVDIAIKKSDFEDCLNYLLEIRNLYYSCFRGIRKDSSTTYKIIKKNKKNIFNYLNKIVHENDIRNIDLISMLLCRQEKIGIEQYLYNKEVHNGDDIY